MSPKEHARLVLNAAESGLDTEIEIAELLLDLAPAQETRAVINSLLVQQVLVLTEDRIEFPTASDTDATGASEVSPAGSPDGLADCGV
jgi:hypothetical protein